MSKKVLVTGAGGFIGSHLTERLVRDGHQVRAFVRYNGRDDRGNLGDLPADIQAAIEVERGDLKDPGAVRRAVEGREWVFHLGALIAIPYSYHNPYDVVQTNVLGTAHVLDACRASSTLTRVVLTSTSEVYGTAQTVPDRRAASASGPVAVRRDQDRRRCAGRELFPRVRAAGHDPAAVQHVRPAAVGPGDHPHDHQPGAGTAERQAGPPRPASRPDLRQGYRRRLRRHRRLRRRAGPGGQHRPGRRHLDRRPGRDDRPAAGPTDRRRDRSRARTGPPPARSSACSPARPWRRASGAGSPGTRSRKGSTRRSPGCATISTGSGSSRTRLDQPALPTPTSTGPLR